MRVSGRKLRLAVGAGVASLMLMLGVTSVGATAPGTVGNVNVVVTSAGASAISSPNTTVTAANYRDAVVVTNNLGGTGGLQQGGPGIYDECLYVVTGNPNTSFSPQGSGGVGYQPKGDTSVTDVTPYICGGTNPIIQPAAYPLWEIQTGTAINGRGTSQVLVVPPTQVNPNGTAPGRAYVIETFR